MWGNTFKYESQQWSRREMEENNGGEQWRRMDRDRHMRSVVVRIGYNWYKCGDIWYK